MEFWGEVPTVGSNPCSDSWGSGWHCSNLPCSCDGISVTFQELGCSLHISAVILVHVYADRAPREQPGKFLAFFSPFWRLIHIKLQLFSSTLLPSFQTSSIRLLLFFFFFFWPHYPARRILVPWPGINQRPWQWKRGTLTTGLPGNSSDSSFSND